jgi:hypothetical protein
VYKNKCEYFSSVCFEIGKELQIVGKDEVLDFWDCFGFDCGGR